MNVGIYNLVIRICLYPVTAMPVAVISEQSRLVFILHLTLLYPGKKIKKEKARQLA